jgi:hypothetical protein
MHLLISLLSPLASAQQIHVALDEDKAAQVGLDASELEADLSSTISDELKLGDQTVYLQQMAQAAILSSKGMGADYASNPQRFVLGGSVGSAVNSSGARFGKGQDTLPEGGFAFQVTAMAGLNLGALAKEESFLRRLTVYGNGMYLDTQGDPFSGELVNYGGHLQIKLVKRREEAIAEWGGLDLTTGFEASDYKLSLSHGLPIGEGDLEWDATGTYTIHSSTMSVPVELSTNIRVAFFGLYGGLAYDVWQSGNATSTISMTGPVMAKVQGQRTKLGSAEVSMGQAGAVPEIPLPRAFVGTQLNIFVVKVYGHVNLAFDQGFGGHAGVRIAL